MTLPNSPGNSGLGRSLGDAAGRGAVLVGIAVLIGLLLLWQGFDTSSGDSENPAATDTTDDDGGDDNGGTGDDSADTDSADTGDTGLDDTSTTIGTGDPTAPSSSAPATLGQAHPPNEVVVFVANGSGIGGEAGRVSDRLTASNYGAEAGNAATQAVETSAIYYREQYGEDAKLVADVLQAPLTVVQQIPADFAVSEDHQALADGANLIVIIGTDGVITG